MFIFRVFIYLLICLTFLFSKVPYPDNEFIYKYVNGIPLHLYVFKPDDFSIGTKKSPAIICYHGGGWVKGKPRQFFRFSKALAQKGMMAISVEYRTKRKFDSTPAEALEDAKSAMRWVKSHVDLLHINPNKIVACGGSAGGQLAAALIYSKGFNDSRDDLNISTYPNALILLNPVLDNGPSGYGYERVEGYWRDFSPMYNINNKMVPALILVGDRDKLVPVSTMKRFKSYCEKKGVYCNLVVIHGAKHGFFNKRKYRKETLEYMEDFLRKLGYIPK